MLINLYCYLEVGFMSTSIIYHLFGVKGYDYQRLTLTKGEIKFVIKKKRGYIVCPKCKSRDIVTRGSKTRSLRALPTGHYRKLYLDVIVFMIQCKSCGARLQEDIPIIPYPKAQHTRVFEYIVCDLLEKSTIKDVASYCKLDWDTVKEIDKRRLKRKQPKFRYKDLYYLALDEVYLGKKMKYKTIVLNLEACKVIQVYDGRGKDAVNTYFKKLKVYGKNLKAIAMDMSGAYYSATKEQLPDIDIVFDHFHIVKLMNEKIDSLRREHQNMLNKKDKKVFKGKRFLLLMNPDNMTEDQQVKLKEVLELNTPLTTAYILKEELRFLWNCQNEEAGKIYLNSWIERANDSEIKQMKQMAKTLTKYKQGVLNYYKHRINNGNLQGNRLTTGPLEGINNKIKTMLRITYGLRDEEYLKLKLLNL